MLKGVNLCIDSLIFATDATIKKYLNSIKRVLI